MALNLNVPARLRSAWVGRQAGQTDAQAAAAGATGIRAADMEALDAARVTYAQALVTLDATKLGYFAGTADQIAAKISADGGRLPGVLYIEQAAPATTTPTLTNYAQAVNERLNAGTITDVVAFGGEASGSSSIASRIINGSGGVTVTRTGSGVFHTFGPRARFPMTGGKTLKAGATIRRNTNWGSTKILTRIRWIASDGVTVISTSNGASAAISSVDFDETRLYTGLVSPSGAAFADIDNVSDATTVATGAAITAYKYVLEEVSA